MQLILRAGNLSDITVVVLQKTVGFLGAIPEFTSEMIQKNTTKLRRIKSNQRTIKLSADINRGIVKDGLLVLP